ncbi:hypothetical protein JAAARDRAFT_199897 [Jaapia argillacea MUCL 33604]|uniref:NAD-dependent epimerase/dehydratase domain-containing protein n=1 Tax=Jaapia argillacea MUCL 33604 TaxID=933084 RepID=A0A067P6W6_9AGAM|nr:hypothetical protein JAAARDRAFT_199897 [Jaapia argillacea MUCL 33604]
MTLASKPLILVTGASGFVGSNVVYEALKAGYRVRGTVRSKKVDLIKEAYATYKEQFEVTLIDDVASNDFSVALKGSFLDVEAVVHVASPLPWATNPEKTLDGAINGALNVLRQGEAVGIKKFVVTSSLWAFFTASDPKVYSDHIITDKDWNAATQEQALAPGAPRVFVYGTSKTLAEKAVWEFAAQHPHIDVTTIGPPVIFGPFAPGSTPGGPTESALSTNSFIYGLLNGTLPPDICRLSVDVRDVARAHVAALTAPDHTDFPNGQDRKRILVAAPTLDWRVVVQYLGEKRPDVKSRLPTVEDPPRQLASIDVSRAREVLGFESFIPGKEAILASVDDLLRLEGEWERNGLKV